MSVALTAAAPTCRFLAIVPLRGGFAWLADDPAHPWMTACGWVAPDGTVDVVGDANPPAVSGSWLEDVEGALS